MRNRTPIATLLSLALCSVSVPALAASDAGAAANNAANDVGNAVNNAANQAGNAASNAANSVTGNGSGEASNAQETVQEAAKVVQQLKDNPETRQTLQQAKAVFIVPDYGRAALGIGGAGGQGVLMAQHNGTWSAPAFYNIGSISLGLEAGASGGQIAFFIMDDKALQGFRSENNFSLNADAGLTVVNWSKRAQASAGKGADVIAWSDTEGLYGDLAVSATDIFWDGEANKAFYPQTASAKDIITGKVQTPPAAQQLKSEFAALQSGPSGGQSEGQAGQGAPGAGADQAAPMNQGAAPTTGNQD